MAITGRYVSKPCSELRPSEYVVISGRACKVLEIEKLGSDQWLIVGRDLFNGGVVEERRSPGETTVDEPVVTKKEYLLTEMDDEECIVICERTGEKKKFPIPEGFVGDDLRDAVDVHNGQIKVIVAYALGEEGIIEYRKS